MQKMFVINYCFLFQQYFYTFKLHFQLIHALKKTPDQYPLSFNTV